MLISAFDIQDAMRETPVADAYWVNAPSARHVARQCISIMDAFCDIKHHNGKCSMFAYMYQFERVISNKVVQ